MAAEYDVPNQGATQAASGGRATGPGPLPLDLAKQLTGNVPCVTCRYNLRGLSVKGVCPECGTPVRAAILAAVDPYAAVLQPMHFPRLAAAGLLLWSGGALLAGLLTWSLRAIDLLSAMTDSSVPSRPLARMAVCAIVLSGIGALALIRPHGRIGILGSLAASLGVACTFAFSVVYARLHLFFDPGHTRPYLQLDAALTYRSELRLLADLLLAAIVVLLRPNARLLSARSLLMRLGRVDRQAMLAMLAAVAIAALGDGLHLLAGTMENGGPLVTAGLFLIALGSMLFTVGLFGVFLDALRVCTVLLNPPLAHSDVVGHEPRSTSLPEPRA